MDYWDVVAPLKKRARIYDDPETFGQSFNLLSADERTLLAAFWGQSEVCSGGFLSLLYNSTGQLAPESATAYDRLGMPITAGCIRHVVSLFGAQFPRDRRSRQLMLRHIWDQHGGERPFDTLLDLRSPAQMSTREPMIKLYFEDDHLMFENGPFAEFDRRFFQNIDIENGGFEAVCNALAATINS